MGILIITWNFPPKRGGIEYLVSHVCAGLRRSHTVLLVTGHAPASQAEEDVFRARWPGVIAFAAYALCRGAALLFRNPEIKSIFGGSVMVTPLVLILARLFGRKSVIQAHGLDLVYPGFFYQLLCVRWLKFCDRVIANSSYTASLAASKSVAPHLICAIPPGVDPQRFNPETDVEAVKKEFGLEARRIILFVGRLAKRKGVKEFIQYSLPEIIRQAPNVCFVVVGANPTESLAHRGDALSDIQAVVSEVKLQAYVRLLGALGDDELSKIYQASDLVVIPALPATDDVEGFGIVLLEAAAAGKPVVATRVGGIPDAVEDGKSGVLIDAENYGELSRSIIALLLDQQMRESMGEYGRRRVRTCFCWDRIVTKYGEVLSTL
jgi:phosphatidylinositol alpha-1,6-mannosyltransferase